MIRKIVFTLFIIFTSMVLLSAESAAGKMVSDPSELIGLDLDEAFRLLGPPDSVSVLRGEEEWQDEVVFFYENRLYLYWYQDRIWQVRFDQYYPYSWKGVSPGQDRRTVSSGLSDRPIASGGDWEIYEFPGYSYPLRLRVFYEEGCAVDFYLYRGDF